MTNLSTPLCAPRPVARAAGLLLAAFFLAGQLSAADFYWSGLSGGSWNIDQDANWFSGGHPSSGDNLYFNNTGGTCGTSGINTPYCNYGAGAWFGNLITYACSGGITWEGDQTYLYKFENQDTVTLQSLANLANRTGPDTALQINPVNGPIIVTNVIMQDGQQLQVYGGNTLTVNGVISESGSPTGATLVILQGATVVLNQAATYTGDTFANSGTLRLSANNALANSGNYLRLGDTANALSANLNLDGGLSLATPINIRSGNSGTMIIANTVGTAGPATYAGNLYLDHDATLYANTNGALGGLVFSGTALDLKNQTLTVDGPGTNLISGVLTNSTGSGMLVKNGAGNLTLLGTSTYSGATTIGGGTLTIGGAGQLGNGTYAGLITNNAAFNFGSSAAQVLSGVISGTGSLTNSSTGPLTLLGVNTYSGGTTLGGTGTIVITNDSALGAASGGIVFKASGTLSATNYGAAVNNPVTIGASRTITVNASVGANFQTPDTNNLVVAAYITGAGGVTKKSSSFSLGTVRFNNDTSDYTGDFTAGFGNTEFTSVANQGTASSLGKGAAGTGGQITLANSTSAGTFRYVGTANSSTARPLIWTATTGGYTLDVTNIGTIAYLNPTNMVAGLGVKTLTLTGSNTGTNTLAEAISNDATNGVISVTKSGAGTWVLSGSNSFSGGLTLAAGQLNINSTNALGTGPFTNSGTSTIDTTTGGPLTLAANNAQYWNANFTNVGSQNLNFGTGAVTLGANRTVTVNANTLTVGGVIGGAFSLTKAGAGTLAISQNATYSGGTTINAGMVDLTGGGGGSGTIRGTATINASGTLRLSVGDATGYNGGASSITPINITGGTLNVNTTANMTLGSAVVNMTGGSITGVSGGNLDFFGGSSTLNTLASATTSTISGVPISPLRQGSTTVTVAAGTTASGIDLDISSVIRTSPSGDASGAVLIKAGSGTMRLSAANTFAKPITVSAGELVGASGGSCANSVVTVNNGATNGVQLLAAGGQWTCAGLTIAPGTYAYGDFNFGSFTPSSTTAPLQVNGNVTFNGSYGIIVRNTTLAVGQYPLIKYTGTISGGQPTFPISVPGGVVSYLSNNVVNKSLDLVVASLSSPSTVFWTNSSSVWDINTTFNWTNSSGASTTYQDGNAVVFNTPASASTVTLNTTVNPAALSNGVAFNSTQNYTVSGSGAIAGPAGVTKSGSGALTLATANSYSGGTILNAGTLYASTSDSALGTGPLTVAGSATLSTISGGGARTLANPVFVATGQTLSLNAANANLTLNGAIGGGGSITPASTGTTTLGGVNTISNTLAVNGGGTLALATGSATTNLGGGITVSTSGSGNALTIQPGAALAGLYLRTADNGSGNNSIVNQLGGTVTLTTSSSTDIRLGHWSTSGNIYNLNGGTLNALNTVFNNGWDGASQLAVNGGTANLAGLANGASGHGGSADTVILQSGTLNIGSSGITQNGAGAKTFNLGAGTLGALAAWSSPVAMTLVDTNTGTTFDTTGGAITLSGTLSGVGSLKKAGGNTLTLSGTNSYAGATVITAGTLQYSTPGSGTMIGAVSGAGALAFGAGTTLNLGGSGNVVSLSEGSPLTLGGGTVVYDLNSPSSADVIAMTGSPALTLSGTTTISPVGAVTNGTYTLISGAGTITGTAANLALATTATNNVRGTPSASFTVSSPTVTMAISGVTPTNLFWQGNSSGTWDINTTANWTNSPGGSSDKFYNADQVTFNDTATVATANGTNVNVSTAVYPGSVAFNNSSLIFGLGGSGSIAGGAVLTKSGTSMVILSNANTFAGGTFITAGTLRVANGSALGTGPLTMTGGTLDLNATNLILGSLSGTAGLITNSETAVNTRTLTVNQVVSNTFAGTINTNGTSNVALVKNGPGYLKLTGASTFAGNASVNAGTLELTTYNNAIRTYIAAQGATLKLGFTQTGNYPGNGTTINGNGAGDPSGLYIGGGQSLTFSSTLTLQNAPSTIRAYGTGSAGMTGGDVNSTHLSVAASASGSVIDPAVNIVSASYGYRMVIAAGINTATGDLLVGSPISSTGGGNGNGGPYNTTWRKEGTGSLLLTNASTYSSGVYVGGGTIILAGGNNRLPSTSGVILNSGTVLQLNGVSQTISDLSANGTGGSVVGGSSTTSTLTINNAAADTNACTIGGTGANQNNLALVKSGAGFLNLSGKLTYTNNTTISAGSMLVSALTSADGATLSVVDVAGTLAATNLTLGNSVGSTVAITGFAGAASAPIVATNLTANGVTTITLAGTFTSGQFPLIQYLSGTKGGTGSFTVQQAGLPRGVSASIVTNSSNKSIDLVLTAYPLVWVGATNGVNVATWDNGTTTNWSLIGSPNYFTNNDNVQIDDTASTNILNLTTNVSPIAVLVTNSAKNFTLSASGSSALTGGMILTKKGSGLLTITESNAFMGGVTISGGAVNLQNGYALNGNTVTLNSGTELELQGGISIAPATLLTLNSSGTNATGGLRNISGNNTYGGPITLNASATRINSDSGTLILTNGVTAGANLVTLGGSGNVAVSTVTVLGSAGLVKDGSGTNIWSLNPNISSGGVTVNAGTLQINNGNFGGTFTSLITVNTNGILWGNGTHSTGGGASLMLNKGTWLMSGEDYKQNLTMVDGLIGPGPNLVSSGGELRVGYAGGAGNWTWYVSNSVAGSVINSKLNTIGSGINLTLNVARGAAAADLTLNGLIFNGGAITLAGNGITQITCPTNNNTGTTTVSGGTLLLTGALGTNTLTVATNATLTGTGAINGATTIQFGGTVQPGLTGADTSSLAVSNALTLAGNALFVLNRTNSQNSSRITGITTATYGGTLTVNNAGDALLPGDAFTLFQASVYVGGFTNVVLPALSSPLVWNTNNLAVNGSIVVQKAPTSLILISSENPSGFNDNVAFTANVTPSIATGTVAFQTNGVTFDTEPVISGSATSMAISVLPRGTNAIAAIYTGDAGYLPSTAGLNQVVTNHPPTAGNATYYRGAVASYKITISNLMTNAADVDGDSLTVSFGTSTNGINLIVSGDQALYYNPSLVNDQLTYTVNDGFGGSATAAVNIASAPFLVGQNAAVAVTGSTATVNFAGIPGYSYGIQRSTNLTDWATIITTNAPSGGLFNYTDDFSDLGGAPGSAYYRLKWNP